MRRAHRLLQLDEFIANVSTFARSEHIEGATMHDITIMMPAGEWAGLFKFWAMWRFSSTCSFQNDDGRPDSAVPVGFYQDQIVPLLINLTMRQRRLAEYRSRMLPAAQGEVLEIGIGSGLNLPFYSRSVEHVISLDPSPKLTPTLPSFYLNGGNSLGSKHLTLPREHAPESQQGDSEEYAT